MILFILSWQNVGFFGVAWYLVNPCFTLFETTEALCTTNPNLKNMPLNTAA